MIENFSQRLAVWQKQYGRHELPWQRQEVMQRGSQKLCYNRLKVQVVVPYFQKIHTRISDHQ